MATQTEFDFGQDNNPRKRPRVKLPKSGTVGVDESQAKKTRKVPRQNTGVLRNLGRAAKFATKVGSVGGLASAFLPDDFITPATAASVGSKALGGLGALLAPNLNIASDEQEQAELKRFADEQRARDSETQGIATPTVPVELAPSPVVAGSQSIRRVPNLVAPGQASFEATGTPAEQQPTTADRVAGFERATQAIRGLRDARNRPGADIVASRRGIPGTGVGNAPQLPQQSTLETQARNTRVGLSQMQDQLRSGVLTKSQRDQLTRLGTAQAQGAAPQSGRGTLQASKSAGSIRDAGRRDGRAAGAQKNELTPLQAFNAQLNAAKFQEQKRQSGAREVAQAGVVEREIGGEQGALDKGFRDLQEGRDTPDARLAQRQLATQVGAGSESGPFNIFGGEKPLQSGADLQDFLQRQQFEFDPNTLLSSEFEGLGTDIDVGDFTPQELETLQLLAQRSRKQQR